MILTPERIAAFEALTQRLHAVRQILANLRQELCEVACAREFGNRKNPTALVIEFLFHDLDQRVCKTIDAVKSQEGRRAK